MRKKNYVRTAGKARPGGGKWLLFALLTLAVAGMLWSLVMGELGAVKYFRMRAREETLRSEIDRLKQDNLRLIGQVRSLRHDPAYLERLARDKIGLARPGEVVYYYGDVSPKRP